MSPDVVRSQSTQSPVYRGLCGYEPWLINPIALATSETVADSINQNRTILTVRWILGDRPAQGAGAADPDTFGFTGTRGDEITVTLEGDPRAGHNGGTASLGLRDAGSFGLSRATSGTPPLELTATLPASGQYSVEVGQPAGSPPFRGAYRLRVRPTTVSIDRLEPAANVEQ
jgi:hypothetical protein